MKLITREWMAKADGDWRVVNSQNRSRNPVYDAICFHAQQTAASLPELAQVDQDARYLTTFAVEIRYPGIIAAEHHAQKCTLAARKIRKIVRSAMEV